MKYIDKLPSVQSFLGIPSSKRVKVKINYQILAIALPWGCKKNLKSKHTKLSAITFARWREKTEAQELRLGKT